MSKRIGPSMSTEPGWMTAFRACPFLLGDHNQPWSQNDPSMLLSFERPATAGPREDASFKEATKQRGGLPALYASPRSLKTAQKPHSAAIDKRRLKRVSPGPAGPSGHVGPDHRQDSKGTRWMPWHQESKKGVNGCDKPRLGA